MYDWYNYHRMRNGDNQDFWHDQNAAALNSGYGKVQEHENFMQRLCMQHVSNVSNTCTFETLVRNSFYCQAAIKFYPYIVVYSSLQINTVQSLKNVHSPNDSTQYLQQSLKNVHSYNDSTRCLKQYLKNLHSSNDSTRYFTVVFEECTQL